MLNLDSRSAPGMGKKLLDDVYLKLGQVEMDDMAEGVKALWSRPYFDKTRVGIYGTSYGGYTSVMAILRHPGGLRRRVGVVAARPPGTTTTRSTPSGTCGFRRRTRRATTKGSAMNYATGSARAA